MGVYVNKHLYKIRRVSDGLYSRGGKDPNWAKQGKIWQSLGDLKRHFAWCNYKGIDIIIEEYEMNKVLEHNMKDKIS